MDFVSDARLAIEVRPSPNHGERRGAASPDILLLHYTGMLSTEEALERLCSPSSEVSAHYVVLEDGTLIQCVPEARRAWHAGAASWGGVSDINSHSIGVEIANPGHDHGYPPFPEIQIAGLIALCRDIVGRNLIRPERVLAHSDVAPGRKTDPGERFPWQSLHAAGIGHWVEPEPLGTEGPRCARGDTGAAVLTLQQDLSRYGYAINPSGVYDEATEAVVAAFQRHFRPARVDGISDASTRFTLERLTQALGRL